MAVPALVTTPGAVDANAYCDLAYFNAYCEAHVDGATALAKTDDQKKQAVLQATREFDAYVLWKGGPTSVGVQALAWPRSGLYEPSAPGLTDPATWRAISSSEIPVKLQTAVAEQARLLLGGGDRTSELQQVAQGITRLDVAGAVAIDFEKSILPRQVIAPSAWAFVSCWGSLVQPNRGGAVPLVRA